jgi:oxysterol-binding protein 1
VHRCGQGKGCSICHQWHVHPRPPLVITSNLQLTTSSDSRSLLTASYRSLLRTYILSPPNDSHSQNLITLLSSPRAKLVDLSYLDDASGTTLLHEATRRKDFRLVDSAVRAGADVFIRDRKGRPVQEVAGKDDKMRVFLRQCEYHSVSRLIGLSHPLAVANNDTTLLNDDPISGPSTLKGYLNKYTNVARGYSTRWFVLKDGILSCTPLFIFFGRRLIIL